MRWFNVGEGWVEILLALDSMLRTLEEAGERCCGVRYCGAEEGIAEFLSAQPWIAAVQQVTAQSDEGTRPGIIQNWREVVLPERARQWTRDMLAVMSVGTKDPIPESAVQERPPFILVHLPSPHDERLGLCPSALEELKERLLLTLPPSYSLCSTTPPPPSKARQGIRRCLSLHEQSVGMLELWSLAEESEGVLTTDVLLAQWSCRQGIPTILWETGRSSMDLAPHPLLTCLNPAEFIPGSVDSLARSFSEPPAGAVCPLCGEPGIACGQVEEVSLRECHCSGRVLLAWAWPSQREYRRFYVDGEEGYLGVEQERNGQRGPLARDTEYLCAAFSRLKQLGKSVADGSAGGKQLLDVGCGAGSFVAAAAALGYDAEGIEPSRELVWAGRRLGRNLTCGSWADVTGEYSLITLHDVLEHLIDPLVALQHLRTRLSRQGTLVVELPEWGCPAASLAGLTWRHIKPRQHLFLPDETAAQTLFARSGFCVANVHRPLDGSIDKIAFYLRPV